MIAFGSCGERGVGMTCLAPSWSWHARLHLYSYQVPSAATATAWEGCLQHLVRRTQKLKGVGPCSRCWQIFTSCKFVCQIHYDRLSQAGKGPIKADSRASKLLLALLWKRHAGCSCVCLGGRWVFWALLSPAGSAVFLVRHGPGMPRLLWLAPWDDFRWPAIATLWAAGLGGHLRHLDFLFVNHQCLCVYSDVFVIWFNPASNKS